MAMKKIMSKLKNNKYKYEKNPSSLINKGTIEQQGNNIFSQKIVK